MTGPTTDVVVEPLSFFDKLSFAWRIPLLGMEVLSLRRAPICVYGSEIPCTQSIDPVMPSRQCYSEIRLVMAPRPSKLHAELAPEAGGRLSTGL